MFALQFSVGTAWVRLLRHLRANNPPYGADLIVAGCDRKQPKASDCQKVRGGSESPFIIGS